MVVNLLKYFIHFFVMLQDIIGNDEIKLDFFFKASLTNDLVNVSAAIYDTAWLRYVIVMLQTTLRLTCVLSLNVKSPANAGGLGIQNAIKYKTSCGARHNKPRPRAAT